MVGELIGGEHLGFGLLRRCVVASVHLGQDLPGRGGVAALQQAADADGVVDGFVLRLPSRAQAQGRQTDGGRADRAHKAFRGRQHLTDDGRRG